MIRLSLDALQVMDAIDRRGSFSGAANKLESLGTWIANGDFIGSATNSDYADLRGIFAR